MSRVSRQTTRRMPGWQPLRLPTPPAGADATGDRAGWRIGRMLRLWPDPDGKPLSDEEIIHVYPREPVPWLRVNFAASLDGAVTLDGFSAGLSGPEDKRLFGILRMLCDALVVGAGTVRNEGYGALRPSAERREWRLANGFAEYPTLVVVSRSLALDPDQAVFADAPVRPIVLTPVPVAEHRIRAVAD